MQDVRQRRRRYVFAAALGLGMLLGPLGLADSPVHPRSSGTFHKGSLTMTLHRGGAFPFEAFLPALPSNCEGEMTITLAWDEQANQVHARLQGQHVLVPHMSIRRTLGVDFFPNPIWPEPKDISDGRYLLWILSPARMLTFYYDATTRDLIGSEFDHPTRIDRFELELERLADPSYRSLLRRRGLVIDAPESMRGAAGELLA